MPFSGIQYNIGVSGVKGRSFPKQGGKFPVFFGCLFAVFPHNPCRNKRLMRFVFFMVP